MTQPLLCLVRWTQKWEEQLGPHVDVAAGPIQGPEPASPSALMGCQGLGLTSPVPLVGSRDFDPTHSAAGEAQWDLCNHVLAARLAREVIPNRDIQAVRPEH